MSFKGNVDLEDTLYFLFTTRRYSSGAPFTLAGTPAISVYEENNLTQITSGVSITADYDSVTGLNQVTVVATAANGYEAGKRYEAVITTGTVDSVSVVGEVVGSFVVGPIAANVTEISGDGPAADNAEAFFDGTGYAGTNNVIPTVTTLTGHTAQTGDNYARLGAPAGASIAADIAAAAANVTTILGKWTGITLLAEWLGALAGKQTANSTARTEIRATGAGSGTYDEATDSLEAIRDTEPLGTAMRGTDGANTTTPPTAATIRAEMDGNSTQLAKLGTPAADVSADIAALKVVADATLLDTGTDGVVVAAASKTGYALTSGERDSIAAALLDLADGVETNTTVREHLRLAAAALYGKSSNGGKTFRDRADSKDRIAATVDGSNNRTAVTLDDT